MNEEQLEKRLKQVRAEKNHLIAKANALTGQEQEILFWLEEINKTKVILKEVKAE